MKTYNLPPVVHGIIFDIDSTLYTNSRYAFEQVDIQVRHFAHLRGMETAMARTMINTWRNRWSAQHGGRKISLGNTLVNFGISISESIRWRRLLLSPALYLKRDVPLITSLNLLKRDYRLICVTNNPVLPARKTLEAIGILDIIPDVIGLDTCLKSKPAIEPFNAALRQMDLPAMECVSVGDRYDLDIALPLEMGMGGILVQGVKDVVKIGEVLRAGGI